MGDQPAKREECGVKLGNNTTNSRCFVYFYYKKVGNRLVSCKVCSAIIESKFTSVNYDVDIPDTCNHCTSFSMNPKHKILWASAPSGMSAQIVPPLFLTPKIMKQATIHVWNKVTSGLWISSKGYGFLNYHNIHTFLADSIIQNAGRANAKRIAENSPASDILQYIKTVHKLDPSSFEYPTIPHIWNAIESFDVVQDSPMHFF